MSKRSKGALTVEACLAFIISMFVMLLLMFFIKVVYVHATIQHAITQAANDIAGYSYIYSISPFATINNTIVDSTSENIDTLNNDIGDLVGVYDSVVQLKDDAVYTYDSTKTFANGMSEIGGISDIQNSIDQAQQIYDSAIATGKSASEAVESIKTGTNTVRDMISDPKALLKNIVSVFASTANEEVKTFLGTQLTKSFMAGYLTDGDIESKIASMQIVGGFDGIDFSGSRFFADKENITIVACYQIESVVPDWLLKNMYLINRAHVRGWLNDVSMPTQQTSTEPKSIWEHSNSSLRANAIIDKKGYKNLSNKSEIWSYDSQTGTATNGITIDLKATSYQDSNKIVSAVSKKADDLSRVKKVDDYKNVKGGEVKNKVFYVIVQPGSDRTELNKAMNTLKETYGDTGIKFEVREEDLDIKEAEY